MCHGTSRNLCLCSAEEMGLPYFWDPFIRLHSTLSTSRASETQAASVKCMFLSRAAESVLVILLVPWLLFHFRRRHVKWDSATERWQMLPSFLTKSDFANGIWRSLCEIWPKVASVPSAAFERFQWMPSPRNRGSVAFRSPWLHVWQLVSSLISYQNQAFRPAAAYFTPLSCSGSTYVPSQFDFNPMAHGAGYHAAMTYLPVGAKVSCGHSSSFLPTGVPHSDNIQPLDLSFTTEKWRSFLCMRIEKRRIRCYCWKTKTRNSDTKICRKIFFLNFICADNFGFKTGDVQNKATNYSISVVKQNKRRCLCAVVSVTLCT